MGNPFPRIRCFFACASGRVQGIYLNNGGPGADADRLGYEKQGAGSTPLEIPRTKLAALLRIDRHWQFGLTHVDARKRPYRSSSS